MFGRSGSSPPFADLSREAQASTSSDVRADPDQSKEKAIVGLEALRSSSLKLVRQYNPNVDRFVDSLRSHSVVTRPD